MFALVTGGAGFIGSHLVDELVGRGWRVRVVDNLSSGRTENLRDKLNSLELVVADLKDPQVAMNSVEGVNVVFHLAANPEVRLGTVAPETHFRENVVATFNLLEAMRKRDVKDLVFASSSTVYGEPAEIPVDESAPIRPVSVYGASKAACESLIHAYSRLYGIRAVVLRFANVVGPRLRHGVIYDLLKKLSERGDELEVLGDGAQVRSYLYIDDAVRATMIAYERSPKGFSVYNVGNRDWITVRELVSILLDELGLKPIVRYSPLLHGVGWPGDVKRIALSVDRLSSLGFTPIYNSSEAVRLTARALARELGLTPPV